MKVLPAGRWIIGLILVMAMRSAKVTPTGLAKKTVVEHFLTAAHSNRNVRHKWMTVKAWASLINKDCPVEGHTIGVDDIHESIRRDPRFKHQEMDGAFNGVGIYRHRVIASETNTKTWCYQYRGLNADGNAYERKDDPVKRGEQWSARLCNPFRMEHGAWPENDLYESSDDENESDANPNDGGDDETSAVDDAAAAPVEEENSSMPVMPDGFEEDENPQDAEFFDRSALPPDTSTWCLSEDARQLFSPQADETTIAAIELRMKVCLAVFQGRMPVEDVLQGHNANCDLSVTARDNLKLRCGHIYWALWCRLENKNSVNDGTCKWIEHCCQYAINKLSDAGVGKVKSPDTVARWHAVFRVLNKFPLMKKERNHLPHFLAANDDIKEAIQTHARENIDDSISLIHTIYDYIHETLLPKMVEEMAEKNEEIETVEDLLKLYGLESLCHETVRTWLLKLGFSHDIKAKSYYVDGHEKKETVRYRWKFIDRYLMIERRMHRWIQMTAAESKQYEGFGKDKVVPGSGHRYTTNDGTDMVEYHVDTLPQFQAIIDASGERGKYGGWLSVRMIPGERPVVCIGQDEAIFKQYIFTAKVWQYEGRKRLLPKDEGLGVMVSAFQSREFGFGYHLTEEDLVIVNQYRRAHRTYVDADAANLINGSDQKKDLTLETNPFCLEFEHGATAEGYWTYDRMVLQLEDCTDVLKSLHPEFDFVFLFDHSCGHDRGRADGLNVSKMRSGYGGAQRIMHSTEIKAEKGYLGKHPRTLKVGDIQHMVFQEGDDGPFWLSPEERLARMHSEYYPPETKPKNKDELLQELKAKGMQPGSLRGKKVGDLRAMAERMGIESNKIVRKEKVKGWMGKPKGLLQVLWERGFIDTTKNNGNWKGYYSLNGTKDARNNLIRGTSLKQLMAECLDFIEEESLLQKKAREMSDGDISISVDRTPKCHPELAGEGIEYSWGAAKNHYRRLPMSDKKGKSNFRHSVTGATCRDDVLALDRIRKFSRRAREYIVAYKLLKMQLDKEVEDGGTDEDEWDEQDLISKISSKKIEDMKSSFKAHRCALDFDAGFINFVCKEKEQPVSE